MTVETADQPLQRPHLAPLLLIWAAGCAFMMSVCARAIANGSFPDPDDIMRLLEVRDWIGGQSWFDVTQYRLNGDAGVAMHWSRLVDIPIAALIMIARPFVGESRAETIAIVAVPLLTLGIAMLLVHRIALKLMSSRAALAAVAATPLSLGAVKQMLPMRIDHHGWQIVLALVGLLACLDQRSRRSAAVAGIAMAVWLNISLEGLPFAVAVGCVFALEWLRDGKASRRLEHFVAALAISSVLIFAATHLPSAWLTQRHDVVTAAYLAGFTATSLSISLIVRARLQRWQTRFAGLFVAGAIALCAMFLVDAHWMSGPFSNLDPLVRNFWYNAVDEGLPMWQVEWIETAMGLAQPLIGLLGAWIAFMRTTDEMRERWTIYLFILLAVTLSSLTVLRISTTASVIAMPGTAYLFQFAFRRARAQSLVGVRVVSTTAALIVMTPAYAFPLSVSATDPRLENAVVAATDCEKASQAGKLQQLPQGVIAAPLDLTPALILNTRDRAIATGHHRNITGMRDTIRLFIGPPDSGKAIIKSRRVDYVVLCPGAAESIRYVRRSPHGLASLLLADSGPNWLERTTVPGLKTLRVWRVRKDLLL